MCFFFFVRWFVRSLSICLSCFCVMYSNLFCGVEFFWAVWFPSPVTSYRYIYILSQLTVDCSHSTDRSCSPYFLLSIWSLLFVVCVTAYVVVVVVVIAHWHQSESIYLHSFIIFNAIGCICWFCYTNCHWRAHAPTDQQTGKRLDCANHSIVEIFDIFIINIYIYNGEYSHLHWIVSTQIQLLRLREKEEEENIH